MLYITFCNFHTGGCSHSYGNDGFFIFTQLCSGVQKALIRLRMFDVKRNL